MATTVVVCCVENYGVGVDVVVVDSSIGGVVVVLVVVVVASTMR
jgi:hypothetical protein